METCRPLHKPISLPIIQICAELCKCLVGIHKLLDLNTSLECWSVLSPLLGENEIIYFSDSPYCVVLSHIVHRFNLLSNVRFQNFFLIHN
jgi:hypothetical protein